MVKGDGRLCKRNDPQNRGKRLEKHLEIRDRPPARNLSADREDLRSRPVGGIVVPLWLGSRSCLRPNVRLFWALCTPGRRAAMRRLPTPAPSISVLIASGSRAASADIKARRSGRSNSSRSIIRRPGEWSCATAMRGAGASESIGLASIIASVTWRSGNRRRRRRQRARSGWCGDRLRAD